MAAEIVAPDNEAAGERGVLADAGMRAERVSPGFGTRATEDAATGVEALS